MPSASFAVAKREGCRGRRLDPLKAVSEGSRRARKDPLSAALNTGFHSLIELLLRHEEDQRARNNVLRQAVEARRHDIVELAVAYGAETSTVSFVDVLIDGT
jgi:hypothetical protein